MRWSAWFARLISGVASLCVSKNCQHSNFLAIPLNTATSHVDSRNSIQQFGLGKIGGKKNWFAETKSASAGS